LPDPAPSALVVRSLLGRGRILVSQGILALLSEEELRALLGAAVIRCGDRRLPLQSACALLAVTTLSLAPREWVSMVFAGRTPRPERGKKRPLSPVSALRFLAIFPIARVFMKLGSMGESALRARLLDSPHSGAAVRKISHAIHPWGPNERPGASSLYLIDPWRRQMLLPFNPR
jgi:hypothetical protein